MGSVATPSTASILASIAGLGLATFVVITMTSFIKISVILFLLRNALGIQQTPPNMVLYGIALLLSFYVMAPVAAHTYAAAMDQSRSYTTLSDYLELVGRAEGPIRAFMLRFTSPGEREFFTSATARVWGPESGLEATPEDMLVVVPAFVLSELQRAFEAGFLLYLPFVTLDLVVTAVLLAMGMSSVSPTTISVPLKLFLFVAISGWTRLMHGLVLGYAS
ncbi:MAG: type III secretion system export apparatus subunit SctR [Janthinobacterium lividum]